MMKATFRLFAPCFLILFILTKAISVVHVQQAKATLEQTQEYTYYYNGQEVNKDAIDLSMYRYTVDDEKNIVYITDQKETSHGYPIVIPIR